jgi:hypothetical protein
LQETFYAEVIIEARWLYDSQTAAWNPNLYVKQEITSEFVDNCDEPVHLDEQEYGTIYVWEMRKISGIFWEKLELNSFPVDIQQLSLHIVTGCSTDECILVENQHQPSVVNREAFLGRIWQHDVLLFIQ